MKYLKALLRFYFAKGYWLKTWRNVVESALAALGAGELLVNVASKIIDDSNNWSNGKTTFLLLILLSVLWGILRNLPRRSVSCNIADVDIPISVSIGNLLNEQGDYVVSCNTTFDTTYRAFVAHESLQGQVQDKYYPDVRTLDSCMDVELKSYKGMDVKDGRKNSKLVQYDPGTVVKTNVHDGRNVYWVALANSSQGGAASCTMYDLQRCLQGLWDYIAEKGNKTKLVMPILGSGRSGLNESRMTILKEILFSFIAYSRNRKIVEELKICICPDDVLKHDIDMHEIEAYLCYNCRENRILALSEGDESSGCD